MISKSSNSPTLVCNTKNRTNVTHCSGKIFEGSAPEISTFNVEETPNHVRIRSMIIVDYVLFLQCLQYSIYFSSLWPFMSQIDQQATTLFFGWTISAYSLGQLVCAPLLGFWSNRTKQCRTIFLICIVTAIIANTMYISAELFQTNQRFVLLIARLFMGLAAGMNGTASAYVAVSSKQSERGRAISVATACMSFGFIAGPVLQAAVSFISYPGYVYSVFHFNLYTAPAYIVNVLFMLSFALIWFNFEEVYAGLKEHQTTNFLDVIPLYSKWAVGALIWCWFCVYTVLVNLDTFVRLISTPLSMIYFQWSREEATLYVSILVGVGSALSVLIYILYVFYFHRFDCRRLIFCGLVITLIALLVSLPYDFWPDQIVMQNENLSTNNSTASPVGCESQFVWCQWTKVVPLYAFVIGVLGIFLGFPPVNVALSTLYANVIGPRQQATLQSVLTSSGSLARLISPVVTMKIFTTSGPLVVWIETIVFALSAMIALVVFYPILVPLEINPKLKAGQSFIYDQGVVTKY
ncbi:Major facilitator superfamily domain-containing protein 8 [Trichinella sp. T8]|nr:Major facilitator superfamily domain-containing protein 8 [Trichinella sp. T8]